MKLTCITDFGNCLTRFRDRCAHESQDQPSRNREGKVITRKCVDNNDPEPLCRQAPVKPVCATLDRLSFRSGWDRPYIGIPGRECNVRCTSIRMWDLYPMSIVPNEGKKQNLLSMICKCDAPRLMDFLSTMSWWPGRKLSGIHFRGRHASC